ncbi:hypothetical protein MKW98_005413 [Papaver atlanticum]|uniref:Uncharacterized protein n=1 Tax=Papaver atlanticum TaxID=357466 RepID=A0AAD4X3X0_9MAGN|nr:hypothetical protein MKW98_005413 [Papaver atlanticum]
MGSSPRVQSCLLKLGGTQKPMKILPEIVVVMRRGVLKNLADENERLALKAALDNVVTQLVQSHVKTVGVRSSKTKLCSNCGKIKKLKTAAVMVMTELDVIERFKAAAHIGDDIVFPRKDMKNRVRALYSASTGFQTQTTNSSGSYTPSSSEALDSPPHGGMQLDHHCIYGSISPSRTPQTHYSRSTSSSATYSSSDEEEYPVRRRGRYSKDDPPRSTNNSTSYSSSQEEDYPVRRRIRNSKADPPRSTSCSTSYSSSEEEDYPVKRRNRYSKADPPQKNTGHVRRFMNKIAGMFHQDRREDTDASSSKEDSNARGHHLSVEKPLSNSILRHRSKEKHMQKRRTTSVNKPRTFPNTCRKASEGLLANTCPDGAFLGFIVSSSISDAVGRRRGFQLSALLMILGPFLSARMESLEGMLLGRFLVGTGIGGVCFWVSAIPAAILALAMVPCGESPQWLHKKGRSAEAEAEFEKLLGGLHVKSAMADLSKSEEMSQTLLKFIAFVRETYSYDSGMYANGILCVKQN